jgi:hypothetical protein
MHKLLSFVRPGTVYTPWGASDYIDHLGETGAIVASTPSHGGAWIPRAMYDRLPVDLRRTPYSDGGWFEEDHDIAIPFAFFGEEFGTDPESIAFARKIVMAAAKWAEHVPAATRTAWGI